MKQPSRPVRKSVLHGLTAFRPQAPNGVRGTGMFGLPLCSEFQRYGVPRSIGRHPSDTSPGRASLVVAYRSFANIPPRWRADGGTLLPSLTAQRFLITGGTGSFGQTMVARLLDAGAEE